MPRMKDKIKNLFRFIGRAWRGGWRGKIGLFMACLALYFFIGFFRGTTNVRTAVSNIWQISNERTELTAAHQKLSTIQKHIDLLKSNSPDYVQELGLRYLNIGNPGLRVLRY